MSQNDNINSEDGRTRGCTSSAEHDKKRCSFGRELRLTTPAQFRQVFEKNSRSTDRYWTILYRSNVSGVARLGMAVAKKRAKRAVDRNRLKRIIRESFRCQQIVPGVDIVVLPRDSSVSANNADLRKSLDEHWLRIARKCASS